MIGEVLYEVAEAVTGVSHGGRQDPKWNGRPGCTSEDDVFGCLMGHGRETNFLNAEHRDRRTMFPILGRLVSHLEGGGERHVACCRFGD